MPRSGAELDTLISNYQASACINPLPFVSTVDSVDMPRAPGAQRTVEYSICRIVSVRLKGYHLLIREVSYVGKDLGRRFLKDNEPAGLSHRETVLGRGQRARRCQNRRHKPITFDTAGLLSASRRRLLWP